MKQILKEFLKCNSMIVKLDSDDWNLDNIAERDIRVSDALKAVVEEME